MAPKELACRHCVRRFTDAGALAAGYCPRCQRKLVVAGRRRKPLFQVRRAGR